MSAGLEALQGKIRGAKFHDKQQTPLGNLEMQGQIEKSDNPYLIMDFWHFAIISTLMVAFFPWSLLFCVVFYGLEETKFICLAMIHDAAKTFFAIASVVLSLAALIVLVVLLAN